MNKRLSQFLQAENISQSQFADTLGVARGGVSHILSGRNRPGYDFLETLLLHYPSLNIDWVITGKGKMYKEDSSEATEVAFSAGKSKIVSKITVFYDDGTFEEFHPER
ncbi:MAG: helix-turn-helix transcriptional regulator [Bacteroidales bacterium]|nr:helix-turn-helix transcriptional regulator [Bacteroidales bacterium]